MKECSINPICGYCGNICQIYPCNPLQHKVTCNTCYINNVISYQHTVNTKNLLCHMCYSSCFVISNFYICSNYKCNLFNYVITNIINNNTEITYALMYNKQSIIYFIKNNNTIKMVNSINISDKLTKHINNVINYLIPC